MYGKEQKENLNTKVPFLIKSYERIVLRFSEICFFDAERRALLFIHRKCSFEVTFQTNYN